MDNMIILIRHCTPNINYEPCIYEDAVHRFNEYNSTSNVATDEIERLRSKIEEIIDRKLTIFASPSPRAQATATALFQGSCSLITDEQFVEWDLKAVYIPFIKLKFRTWAFISRIIWILGLLKSERSFADERLRSRKCAQKLELEAQNGSVALIAHGLLNLSIAKGAA